MKKIFYFTLFIVSFNIGKAQDLIVTVTGDSLNCKITQVQKEYIFFFYEREGEIIKSSVPVNVVSYYEKDYYAMPGTSIEKAKNKDKVRFGAYGGFSYMIGKVPVNFDPILQDHLERLKKGFHLGGDVDFLLSKNVAVGVKYSFFMSKDEMNSIMFSDTAGRQILGKIAENVHIHYIAPNVLVRAGKAMGKVSFVFDGSIGCFIYRNNGTLVQSDFKMKGIALGVSLVPGIELKVSPNFCINLNLGLNLGVMNSSTMEIGGQTSLSNEKENLSRIDVSVGLHWYK